MYGFFDVHRYRQCFRYSMEWSDICGIKKKLRLESEHLDRRISLGIAWQKYRSFCKITVHVFGKCIQFTK